MHIRFSIPSHSHLYNVQWLMEKIGNPKMAYLNYSFTGEVNPEYLPNLYDLQSLGKILNLGFLVVSDEPLPVGEYEPH